MIAPETFSEAAKECSDNPNCLMFYYDGYVFGACGETDSIIALAESKYSILYQRQGNKIYTQFKSLRGIV